MGAKYADNNILFVDDEVNILRSLRRGLIKEPFGKFFAKSGQDALDIMAQEDIHVIVSDMRMPGMTGLELLNIVHEKYPDTIKIVLSGYAQLPQVLATINQVNIFKFMTKPWNMEQDLKRIIHEAFDYYNLRWENDILRTSLEKKNDLYQKLLRDNDEKIMTMKQDIDLIVNLQTDWSATLSSLSYDLMDGVISPEVFEGTMDVSNRLYSGLMANLPSELVQLKFEWLIDEVNRIVKRIRYPHQKTSEISEVMVQFYEYQKVEHLLRGHHKMLLFVFKLIFEWLLMAQEVNEYSVIVQEEPGETQKHSKLIFLIHQERPIFQQDKRIREMVDLVLQAALRCFNGRYQLSEKEGKNLIVLETYFNVVES